MVISSATGVQLAASLHLPHEQGGTVLPAAIVLHGFGGYKEQVHIDGLAASLARHGIAAVCFDASGIGESGGEHIELYTPVNFRIDVASVISWVFRNDYFRPSRLGLAGHSMGGMMSVIVASQDSRVSSTCAISPPDVLGHSKTFLDALPGWKMSNRLKKANPHHGTVYVPFSFSMTVRPGAQVVLRGV